MQPSLRPCVSTEHLGHLMIGWVQLYIDINCGYYLSLFDLFPSTISSSDIGYAVFLDYLYLPLTPPPLPFCALPRYFLVLRATEEFISISSSSSSTTTFLFRPPLPLPDGERRLLFSSSEEEDD